jgi:carbon-monoxide dehydrogenase medium subunit
LVIALIESLQMSSFEIVEPRTVEEAFGFLAGDDPAIRPIAGGTALMLMMKAQVFRPVRLVSLRALDGRFAGIAPSERGTLVRIGAMTTFTTLERSANIRRCFPVIAETMRTLANVRVRNVATVGGNLAHADPHLDLPPVWIALGADAVILSPAGERAVPVEDIFAGYYETNLGHDDLIAELRVPIRPAWRTTYVKVTPRSAHDWPALGLAVSASLQGQRVTDVRVVLSAATDRPTRLAAAEAALRGAELDDATLRRAGEAAADEVVIESDDRGSSDYKKHLLRVYLGRAMRRLAGDQPGDRP